MGEAQRAQLVRCERHGLAYDPHKTSGCVLCRSESRPPPGFPPLDRVLVGLLAALVVMLLGGVLVALGTPTFERWLGATSARPDASAKTNAATSAPVTEAATPELVVVRPDGVHSPVERGPARNELPLLTSGATLLRSGTFTLRTKNSIGRSGALFIPLPRRRARAAASSLSPANGRAQRRSGSSRRCSGVGARSVAAVQHHSSCRRTAPMFGRVTGRPGDDSVDLPHVRACLDELYAIEGLQIDAGHVLAAGHSGGGSTAAYLGTTDARFRAFAVLHGGVFAGGLGSSQARGWFSTGADDPLRPPVVVQRAADATARTRG